MSKRVIVFKHNGKLIPAFEIKKYTETLGKSKNMDTSHFEYEEYSSGDDDENIKYEEYASGDDIQEKEYDIDEYLTTFKDDIKTIIKKDDGMTKEILSKVMSTTEGFTSILRVASLKIKDKYRFPNIVNSLKIHVNMRPLPLKLYDSKGKIIIFFDHQIDSIAHIRNREALTGNVSVHGLCGSIIKLEMGLGKTLTAAATSLLSPKMYDEPQSKGSTLLGMKQIIPLHGEKGFPILIIASKTVIQMWKRDGFEKFFTKDVKVLYLHKTFMSEAEIKLIDREEIVRYDFVVTSYDFVVSASKINDDWKDNIEYAGKKSEGKILSVHCRKRIQADNPDVTGARILFFTPWERAIFDESQRFANPDTVIYRSMMSIYARYKLCLTGTPIRNYDTDIWAQLRICGYNGVYRKLQWKKQGCIFMKNHNLNKAILSIDYKDTNIVLPEKIRTKIEFKFDGMEKTVYDFILGVTRNVYDMMMSSKASFACVLALFTRLRQVCCAGYLMTDDAKRKKLKGGNKKNDALAKNHLSKMYEPGPIWSWMTDRDGTAGIRSQKMRAIIKVLSKIPKNEKVLIFSSFTSCLDLIAHAIEVHFKKEKFVIEQLDGDTIGSERDGIVATFNQDDALEGGVRALLLTYKVGSEGLNLTQANNVICVDPWWTSVVEDQAVARCHRPGQTKKVRVYNIYAQNSIENRVLDICSDKKSMTASFLEGTGNPFKKSAGLNKSNLADILGMHRF